MILTIRYRCRHRFVIDIKLTTLVIKRLSMYEIPLIMCKAELIFVTSDPDLHTMCVICIIKLVCKLKRMGPILTKRTGNEKQLLRGDCFIFFSTLAMAQI